MVGDHTSNRLLRSRIIIAASIIAVLLAILLYNLYKMQVTQHSDYQTTSDSNRFDLMPVSPPRGIIYDRNGTLLADNRTNYNLELLPSLVKDKNSLLATLQVLLKLDEQTLTRIEKKIDSGAGFRRIVLLSNLQEDELTTLAHELHRIPELDIAGRLVRYYPENDLFSHVIGYVGLLSAKDLTYIDRKNYLRRDYIGKIGIEKYYETALRGKLGLRRVEVNAQKKILASANLQAAQAGDDLMLTIDTHLQRVSYDALGDYQGAVVALDPRDGSVLALISKPAFNPNLFSYHFSNEQYRQLHTDSSFSPFFNRAVTGQYAPGSTLKPVVALAGLKFNTVSMEHRIYAGPYYQIPGYKKRYRDWRARGHGWVDLSLSIIQSCDVYFYDLAHRMGVSQLAPFLSEFGLGQPTGIDTTSESTGLVPTPKWKYTRHNQKWFPAETIMMGIGQSYLLMTPLQLAAMTATLANRGRKVKPYLVHARRRAGHSEWQRHFPDKPLLVTDNPPADWDYVHEAMRGVVHYPNGTAYKMGQSLSYTLAGKTGTVQTQRARERNLKEDGELERKMRDHAMFIGFAPAAVPQIAIAVVVEHVGSGSQYAAPIARTILDAYFEKTTLTALSDDE